MLRWIGALSGLLLVLGSPSVQAQSTAEAFFHEAAQQYVEGNRAAARQVVKRGLEVAPSDPRLQALRKKLEQRGTSRGGGRSSQGGQQHRSPDQQSGTERTRDDQSGKTRRNATSQSERGRSSNRSSRRSGQEPSDAARGGGDGRRRGEKNGQGGRKRRTNVLSHAQARQLLRALETQEKKLLRELRVRGTEQGSVEKDW